MALSKPINKGNRAQNASILHFLSDTIDLKCQPIGFSGDPILIFCDYFKNLTL